MGCASICTPSNQEQNVNLSNDALPSNNEEVKGDFPKTIGENQVVETNVQSQDINMNSENLNTELSKKKTLDKKANFVDHFLKEMNACRTNPAAYAANVEKHIQYIQENPDTSAKNAAFYVRDGMPKISLTRGVPAFQEFADKLRTMQPMPKIESRQDLQVPIHENSSNWTSKEYIGEAVNKVKSDIKGNSNYKNFNFHFDVGSPYSENSFILQLVDDTPFKGSRSRNILNPAFTYVGISSLKIKNKHCGYFLFAN